MNYPFDMRRLSLVCFSVFLAAAELFSQSQDQSKLKLSGTVVNSATGEPVRGAMVQVFGAQSHVAMTGADGRFEIDGLSTGSFTVMAQRPGFDPQGSQRQVTLSGETTSVSLKLAPLAKISGRIVDRDGEPIDGVGVQCMKAEVINGRRRWQQMQGGSTDDTGHFILEDMAPGSYIIYTREMQLYPAAAPKSEAARFIYPQTFYPDAPSRDAAQTIQVRPGEEARADMTLHSMRGYRVTFSTDPPYQNVMATIGNATADAQQQFEGRGARTNGKGLLTFPAVPQGSWKITVRGPFMGMRKQNEEPMYGELPIDVNGTDLENLVVPLNKLPDVQVLMSGGTGGMFFQLQSTTGQGYGSEEQNGVIQFHSVQPGTYRVTWQPQETCIGSMTSGSVDLLKNELVISAGASVPPITVEKGENCGSLTINTQNGARGIAVVTSALEPRIFGLGGSPLKLKNLPEGEYTVYAFDDLNNLEYSNPDAMRDFKGQTVKVAPGQSASVQLELNQRNPQ